MGEGPYSSQYLQNPSIAAGGKFFRMECFGSWTTLPKLEPPEFNPLQHFYRSPLDVARQEEDCFVKISAIDCAGTDNVSSGGSFTAIVTVLVNLVDGCVYVLDCERWRNIEFFALRQNIVLHLARHSPNQVICEANDGTGGRIWKRSEPVTTPIGTCGALSRKSEQDLQEPQKSSRMIPNRARSFCLRGSRPTDSPPCEKSFRNLGRAQDTRTARMR